MATAYVYSPFTGYIDARSCYCGSCGTCAGNACVGTCLSSSGTAHPITQTGYASPIDINASYGTSIRLYVNSVVKSITTTRIDNVCSSVPTAYKRGVRVNLYCNYNAQGTYIGTVFYGHVESAISNGTYNSPSGTVIGTIPKWQDCNCSASCYPKDHVHMERSGGSTGSGLCCGYYVYNASSVIYSWSFTCVT